MLLQSFGVSHMKLGGDEEFRSVMRGQSVTVQLLGFAWTMWVHRVGLLRMSVKKTKGLCSGVYGPLAVVSQPLCII
jgi:hypothetical protein